MPPRLSPRNQLDGSPKGEKRSLNLYVMAADAERFRDFAKARGCSLLKAFALLLDIAGAPK